VDEGDEGGRRRRRWTKETRDEEERRRARSGRTNALDQNKAGVPVVSALLLFSQSERAGMSGPDSASGRPNKRRRRMLSVGQPAHAIGGAPASP
jgi:hypothetical protein